jgi:hypothetical protein
MKATIIKSKNKVSTTQLAIIVPKSLVERNISYFLKLQLERISPERGMDKFIK